MRERRSTRGNADILPDRASRLRLMLSRQAKWLLSRAVGRRSCRRRRIWQRPVALAGVAVLLGATAAQGNEPLTLVTGTDYRPFTDPDLPKGGLAVAVLEAAFAQEDRAVTVKFRPWKRGYQQTVRGVVDGTFPYVRTPKRAEDVRFSDPLFKVKPQVISPADDPLRFDGTKASLDGKRLCLPTGYAPQPIVKEMMEAGRLSVVKPTKLKRCLPLVIRGRVDFVVANNFVWPSLVADSKYSPERFHVANDAVTINKLYFIVGKAHPEAESILATVNAGLASIRQSGQFDAIVDRHLAGQS